MMKLRLDRSLAVLVVALLIGGCSVGNGGSAGEPIDAFADFKDDCGAGTWVCALALGMFERATPLRISVVRSDFISAHPCCSLTC